ncbi:Purine-cytosine permease fcyB [Psilocybe cubensis]|uniref:Purine-cytosine permease fcyB n=1 Tax=Psilocybe cubensis TaxID=181762 RepID=A0ACB8GP95_PSICU|nr:Purine-cytosine permease fcyB [Psilocybe cubensis]KAH9477486.1 Purine-cytosine permease fcyB [Psilocybe cubensis]
MFDKIRCFWDCRARDFIIPSMTTGTMLDDSDNVKKPGSLGRQAVGSESVPLKGESFEDTAANVNEGTFRKLLQRLTERLSKWGVETEGFESFAWVPAVITFPTLLGLANKHLNPSTMPSLPTPSASMMLSFASFVASGVVSWCTITPDYGVYHDHNGSAFKIFLYSYFGFLLPSVGHIVAWGMMGAAFAAAEPGIPSWKEGYDNGNDLGGLLGSVLSPTAIVGARRFYRALVDILSVIGYWSTSFGTIVLIEHFVFRTSFQSYDIERWDKAELLPPGIAAVIAFLGSLGIIIPSMQQTWYTGPIAASGTGDIGVFTGAAVTVLLYTPLRAIERRIWPGR